MARPPRGSTDAPVDKHSFIEAVEEHRETLEKLAASDLDLRLVEDARRLLEEADSAGDGG